MADVVAKKVFLKRDNKNGWIYICPHCLKRISIGHNMKACYYCNGLINSKQCSMYNGEVKR